MQVLKAAVEKYTQLILDTERYIWNHAETGYKEIQTSKYMEEVFKSLGYELTLAGDIPGFYTVVDTGRPGPEVMILAELDSIICPAHPEANPGTGAVHSCGHNAQCAALVGIAAALKETGVLEQFCGRVRLCAVPAEELLEIEYRNTLKAAGTIKYMGGKPEFLSRGYFDGVDMAFMVHTSHDYCVTGGSVGCLAKKITFKGVAAHAGGCPWDGKNALYAATCGINAINAIRETFQEPDLIRVHPIITHGGAMVNAIPAITTLESYVRGASFEAIVAANKKVNRALCGAALSLGANVDITDIPGYAPHINDPGMVQVVKEAVALAVPEYPFTSSERMGTGSTDMGDLSCIMPVVHPYAGGNSGTSHGSDYQIADPIAACVGSAKMQLAMLKILLGNEGQRAKQILQDFKPRFASKEEYLAYIDKLDTTGDRIEYCGDDAAKVKL